MSNKINAIYDALDNGNPKTALRLCQTYLQKTSSNLVKALMALSLSRMDQSEAAVAVCEDIMKSTQNPDAHAVETMTYVLRREQKFSLLAQLLSNTVDRSQAPTKEMLIDCFTANVQANSFTSLPPIALKLFKLTNDTKYLAWYAFALSRGPFTDKETENRTLGMVLLSLDKVLATARAPSAEGMNRWSTSGRMNMYIRLFKVQILKKLTRFDQAIDEVEKIDSTLISSAEKRELIADLHRFAGREKDDESHQQETGSSPSILQKIHEFIRSDASLSSGNSAWSSEENHSKFVSLFMDYLDQSIDRSDCIVVCSPLIGLLSKEDVFQILEKINPLLTSDSPRTLVNAYKLKYALGQGLDVEGLFSLAKPLVESENCLDECSPGKQLLLLAAIGMIDEGKFPEALSVLSFGSSKFLHCSHFRLVEFLVYSKILAWPKKALERFESLGIKNAQWRSLFWLIEPLINTSYTSPDHREHISYSIHNFFDRHSFELKQNYRLILDECMFWKFDSGEISGLPSQVWTEVEKFWSELIEDFEVTQEMREFEISDNIDTLEFDYSPLLFICMHGVGEGSTQKFWESFQARESARPLCCGFQWLIEQPHPPTASREDRFEKFSKNLFPGKFMEITPEESAEFMRMRRDIMQGLTSVIRAEKHIPQIVVPLEFSAFYQELVDLLTAIAGEKPVSETTVTPVLDCLSKLQESIGTSGFVLPRDMGACLNGWIQAVVVLLEFWGSKFSKKSDERKLVKQNLKFIYDKLVGINKALESLKTNLPPLETASEFYGKDFAKKFAADYRAEIDMIKSGFKAVIDRINLGKV